MNKRAGELIAARPENAQRQPYACLRHVPGAMCYVAALTGAAHLFLLDAMLGLSIQLAFLLVGCIPGTRRGHYAILGFSKKVREVAEEQRVDMQFSTAGTLKWLNLKNVLEREREYTARGAVRSAGASARRPTMHATVAAAQAPPVPSVPSPGAVSVQHRCPLQAASAQKALRAQQMEQQRGVLQARLEEQGKTEAKDSMVLDVNVGYLYSAPTVNHTGGKHIWMADGPISYK